jgi:hypothetical protein
MWITEILVIALPSATLSMQVPSLSTTQESLFGKSGQFRVNPMKYCLLPAHGSGSPTGYSTSVVRQIQTTKVLIACGSINSYSSMSH